MGCGASSAGPPQDDSVLASVTPAAAAAATAPAPPASSSQPNERQPGARVSGGTDPAEVVSAPDMGGSATTAGQPDAQPSTAAAGEAGEGDGQAHRPKRPSRPSRPNKRMTLRGLQPGREPEPEPEPEPDLEPEPGQRPPRPKRSNRRMTLKSMQQAGSKMGTSEVGLNRPFADMTEHNLMALDAIAKQRAKPKRTMSLLTMSTPGVNPALAAANAASAPIDWSKRTLLGSVATQQPLQTINQELETEQEPEAAASRSQPKPKPTRKRMGLGNLSRSKTAMNLSTPGGLPSVDIVKVRVDHRRPSIVVEDHQEVEDDAKRSSVLSSSVLGDWSTRVEEEREEEIAD
jgi:hypothetical protein|eukprot:SAG25_NODE_121_length_14652_cov_9.937607_15_plen_346_part_00